MYHPEAVAAFSQQLGIQAEEQPFFGWIAEVGLQAPLPPRWLSETDPNTSCVYYVNSDTNASAWENPLAPHLRRILDIGRQYLKEPSETFFEDQKGVLWRLRKQELDIWHGPFSDPEGKQYFVDSVEGVSSWHDPRVEAQQLFELECSLLENMEDQLPTAEMLESGCDIVLRNAPTLFRTESGAEVMTLEPERPVTAAQRRMMQTMERMGQLLNSSGIQNEHRFAVEGMKQAAQWMRDAQQDDIEAQRLRIRKRAEDRERRRGRSVERPRAPTSAAVLPPREEPRQLDASFSRSVLTKADVSLCSIPISPLPSGPPPVPASDVAAVARPLPARRGRPRKPGTKPALLKALADSDSDDPPGTLSM